MPDFNEIYNLMYDKDQLIFESYSLGSADVIMTWCETPEGKRIQYLKGSFEFYFELVRDAVAFLFNDVDMNDYFMIEDSIDEDLPYMNYLD